MSTENGAARRDARIWQAYMLLLVRWHPPTEQHVLHVEEDVADILELTVSTDGMHAQP